MAFTAGDKMGRKKTIIFGLACNTVGAVLQISSFQLPQMIIGRIINGFGMGMRPSLPITVLSNKI
jgi:MFS family permease